MAFVFGNLQANFLQGTNDFFDVIFGFTGGDQISFDGRSFASDQSFAIAFGGFGNDTFTDLGAPVVLRRREEDNGIAFGGPGDDEFFFDLIFTTDFYSDSSDDIIDRVAPSNKIFFGGPGDDRVEILGAEENAIIRSGPFGSTIVEDGFGSSLTFFGVETLEFLDPTVDFE